MPAMFATSTKSAGRAKRAGKPAPGAKLGQGLARLGRALAANQPSRPAPTRAAAPARMGRDVQAPSLAAATGPLNQAVRRTTSLGLPAFGGAGGTGGKLVDAAKDFLGQPYKWGGGHDGTMGRPGPVDCSGLVQQAGRRIGVNLDGTAASQQRKGRPVSMNDLKPGDLVFRGSPAHHVGIYAGGGMVIHAPKTGSNVQYVSASYFHSARRVVG